MLPMLKHVLLIDNDKDTREMMYMWLGRYGLVLTTARTPGEGVQLARRQRFDLYLLGDLQPAGSGERLCRRLHALDDCIPIVFYTKGANRWLRRQALAAGARVCLTKPDDLQKLGPIIARLLEDDEGGTARVA